MKRMFSALLAGPRVTLTLGVLALMAAAAALALYPAPALAQEVHQCPSGPGPGEALAYRQPDGNGVAGLSFCYYVDDGPSQQEPSRPTGYWQKTWGAIAADGKKGILGAATGVSSRQIAESTALNECRGKGGSCKVFSYYNQCAVLVSGNSQYFMQGAESISIASELGMKDCNSRDKGCRVYYSACTEPTYHEN